MVVTKTLLPLALAAGAILQGAAAASVLEPNFYARVWGEEGTPEELENEAACINGKLQSPVNLKADIHSLPKLPEHLHTQFNFPEIKDPKITNTGHSLKMSWDPATAFDMSNKAQFPRVPAGGDSIKAVLEDPSLEPDRMLTMIPVQMHWHVTSEHSWDGMLGAAEAHIVTFVAEGEASDWGCDVVWQNPDAPRNETNRQLQNCVAVFGIMYRLEDEEDFPTDEFFFKVEDSASFFAGEEEHFDENPFKVQELIPEDRSYYSYVGSLTTPPCMEGLRWHVFNEQQPMSRVAYERLEFHTSHTSAGPGQPEQHYRHNNRAIQPFGPHRTLYFADSGAAEIPGIGGKTCPYGGDHGAYGA